MGSFPSIIISMMVLYLLRDLSGFPTQPSVLTFFPFLPLLFNYSTTKIYNLSGEGINWEIGVDIDTVLYIKEITSKVLLNSTGNSTQYSVMAYTRKEPTEEWVYLYVVKNLPAMQETWVRSLGQKDLLKKEMATHSSILGWRILWTEEPGGLHTVHGVAKSQTRLSN